MGLDTETCKMAVEVQFHWKAKLHRLSFTQTGPSERIINAGSWLAPERGLSPPLLSVIYPVFDTRGDVIESIRLWTEKQEIEPHRYRMFVVAGAGTHLDETALRKVLRNHDVILRV